MSSQAATISVASETEMCSRRMKKNDVHEMQLQLMELCAVGDVGKVYATLTSDKPIDVNYQHPINKWSALHWASRRGHERVVDLLLEHGADPTLQNSDNQTPLDLAQSSLVKSALSGYNDLHMRGLSIVDNHLDGHNTSNVSNVSNASCLTMNNESRADALSASDLQNTSMASLASSFVPNYIKNPSIVPCTQTSCSDPIGANSVGGEQFIDDTNQSRHSSRLSSVNVNASAPCIYCNDASRKSSAVQSCSHCLQLPSTSPTTPMRLCVALPIIFKSAHEPEKKLYRNVYVGTKAKLTLATFHKHVAAAIQLTVEQLTSSRYVIVNEYDATLIENANDIQRLVDGNRVSVFERR